MKNEKTSGTGSRPVRWVLYVVLFGVAAMGMMCLFGIVYMYTSILGWLIAPSGLIYGAVLLVSLVVFAVLYLLGRRKRWGWLKALSLGGASVPALLAALVAAGPFILPEADSARTEKPNQASRATSPSGMYVLTVPIERSTTQKGPLGYGFPYWHVTISDPNGQVVYRDAEDKFDSLHSIYWAWGDGDIVWLYNSDDGSVYYYQCSDGRWARGRWGSGKTGYAEQDIAPPASLYPSYVSPGPVQNLGTPWQLSGFGGGADPNMPVMVFFRNVETGQSMMLAKGESKNGVTLLDASWDKKQAVVEIKGRQFTLPSGPAR